MVSIPRAYKTVQAQEFQNQIATLETENRQLQAENRAVKAAFNRSQAELHQLKQQLEWEKRLFANSAYSFSEKFTIWAGKPLLEASTPNEQGMYHIPLYKVAPAIGASPKTVGRNFIKLSEATTDVKRAADRNETELGAWQTDVYVAFSEQLLTRPDQTTRLMPRNQGGKRTKRCQDCGSDNLAVQKMIVCLDCGCEQSKTLIPVNPIDDLDDYQEEQDDDDQDTHEVTQGIAPITQNNVPITHGIAPTTMCAPHDDPQGIAPTTQGNVPTTMHNHHDDHNGHGTPGTTIINGSHDSIITIAPPEDNLSLYKNQKAPEDNLSLGFEKPPTPPCQQAKKPAILPGQDMKEQLHPEQPETERDLPESAKLLLDIAGDTQEHLVMNANPHNPKKYLTVHRPLTLEDMRQHLLGTKTVGATLTRNDGTTRALCFDGDDDRSWQTMTTSAQLLIANGYKPLLDPFPAGRGGHLWIIFTDRVHAQAAYTQVCAIAPLLKDCGEYWPSTRNQKVRLPAGKYVTPTFSQWTHLYDAHGDELPASALLTHQTPTELIPASDITEPEPKVPDHPRNRDGSPGRKAEHQGVDEYHRRKYGQHEMWVVWPSEQYLIDRFNAQHTIDDLATRERSGMINAATIGRPERTASVGVTPDGQRFTDFGAGARRADGTQDGGDPFEFYIRSHNLDKADVLRELGQALNREASQELLRSARAGELPPAWVMDIITDKGWAVYNENASRYGHDTSRYGHNTLEDHNIHDDRETVTPAPELHRGVVGFSDAGKNEKQVEEQGIPEDFTTDTPCEHCGCCLYRKMLGSMVCARCYPPRGYHNYSDLIDDQYPRRKRLEFS